MRRVEMHDAVNALVMKLEDGSPASTPSMRVS